MDSIYGVNVYGRDVYQLLGPCTFLLFNPDAKRVIIIEHEHVRRYVVPFTRSFISDTTTSVTWKDIYSILRNLDKEGISFVHEGCPDFVSNIVGTILWNNSAIIKSTTSRWEDWKDAVECALIFIDAVVLHVTQDITFNEQIASLLDQLESYTEQNSDGLLIEQATQSLHEPSEIVEIKPENKFSVNTEEAVLKVLSALWTSDVGVMAMSAHNITHFCRILLDMLSFLKLASIKTTDNLIPVIRDLLFAFAKRARQALLGCFFNQWNSTSKWIGLPIGCAREIDFATPSVSLMHSLCTCDLIDGYPDIILSVIKAHAALCLIPRSAVKSLPRKTDDDFAVVSLLNGVDAQHEWVGTLLITVYNHILDESIDFLHKRRWRKRFIENLTPLAICQHKRCMEISRHLIFLLLHIDSDNESVEVKPMKSWKSFDFICDPVDAAPSFRQIFYDMSCFLQSAGYLSGIKKILLDQNKAMWGLKLTDPRAQGMVAAIDEGVEAILNFAERNIGWKALVSAPKYNAIMLVLSDVLKEMSSQVRYVVSDSFRVILEDGAYAKLPGCAELLSANVGFKTTKREASSAADKSNKHPTKPAKAEPSEKQKMESFFPPVSHPKTESHHDMKEFLENFDEEEFLDQLEKEEMEIERQVKQLSSSNRRIVKAAIPSKSTKQINDEMWQQQVAALKQENMQSRNAFQSSKDPKSALEAAAAEAIHHSKVVPPKSLAKSSKGSADNSFLGSDSEGEETDAQPRKKPKEFHNGFLMLAAKLGLNSKIPDQHSSSSADPTQKNSSTKRSYAELYRMNRDGISGGMSSHTARTVAETLTDVSADTLLAEVLRLNLHSVREEAEMQGRPAEDKEFEKVPIRFIDESQYISKFEPLLVDEVKAALVSQISQWRSSSSGGSHKMRYNNHGATGGSKVGVDREFTVALMKCTTTVVRPSCKDIAEVQLRPVHQAQSKAHFVKDDLILILHSQLPKDILKIEDLIRQKHSLAIVTTQVKPSTEFETFSRNEHDNNSVSVLMLSDRKYIPLSDRPWDCVPIMGMSTFIREWMALHSVHNHTLVPLAPYLMKASPVVSSIHLSSIHEAISAKLQSLENAKQHRASAERVSKLNELLLADLQSLLTLFVDGSVLKTTGIVKSLMLITDKKSKKSSQDGSGTKCLSHADSGPTHSVYSVECAQLATQLIQNWKAQVKTDHKLSTIHNLKGGNVLQIPSSSEIEKPRCIPGPLWRTLRSMYNISQLFAIKYISDQFEGGQDTRIALVQGPPGTGKTSTILGMVSALLHRNIAESSEETAAPAIANAHPVIAKAAVYEVNSEPKRSHQRLLICAPSNAAVDEILLRLSKGVHNENGAIRALKIVRLGEHAESSGVIQAMTLEAQVESLIHKDLLWNKLQEVVSTIKTVEENIAIKQATLLKENRHNNGGVAIPIPSSAGDSKGVKALRVESDAAIALEKEIKSLKDQLVSWKQMRSSMAQEIERMRGIYKHTVLSDADIVAATLSGSGKQQFLDHIIKDEIVFDTCIIDEAAQSTEPSTLIPLRFGCRRLVLVGDPRQLPATVLSQKAERAGLGISLFERLERAEHEVVMLTIQYRMHPEIRLFPSERFYHGLLVDADIILEEVHRAKNPRSTSSSSVAVSAERVRHGVISPILVGMGIRPVSFYDINRGAEVKVGKSWRNDVEVEFIVSFLERAAGKLHHHNHTIAVITPYKAQVHRFKEAFHKSAILSRLGSKSVQESSKGESSGNADDVNDSETIEINTVDGFQGREKDIVIFSCVRADSGWGAQRSQHHSSLNNGNSSYSGSAGASAENGTATYRSIGFVSDERRMNVALTRARKALVIVGSSRKLKQDALWDSLLQSLYARGLILGESGAFEIVR